MKTMPLYFLALLFGLTGWHPVSRDASWELSGIAQDLHTLEIYSFQFDLVKLTDPAARAPATWAAVGVLLPDGTYLSLLDAYPHRGQVQALFKTPRAVTLRVDASLATPDGIVWERCPFETSLYCRVARLVEATAPSYLDLPLQGPSNLFIHTGYAPPHPRDGFLVWPVYVHEAAPTWRPCPPERPCPW